MTPLQAMLALGAILNSALYLSGVFIAGILINRPDAWKAALVCAGICFLSYSVQMVAPLHIISKALVFASFLVGIIAGMSLIW